MNYFINENIFTLNSGTEFSAIERLKLFKEKGQSAKILTRNYNANLIADIARVNLADEDVLNMYHYFQDLLDIPCEDVNVRYAEMIDKRRYHIEGIDANASLIKYHGETVAKVNIAPATVGLIGSVDWYNQNAVVTARDIWDRRGFKSSTQYFHPDGSLGPQIFFDSKGKPKIELTYMNIQGRLAPTSYKLLDYKGKVWRFNSENELFAFFLTEIAQKDPAVFINDRPSLTDALVQMQAAAGKWQFLHNCHLTDNRKNSHSQKISPFLQPLFTQFNHALDGVIVATEQQKEDIERFHAFHQILVIPDSYVGPQTLKKEVPRRKSIAYLGRLAADKGVFEGLKVFAKVHQKMPEVSFDFYGYASPTNVQQEIESEAEKLGIKEALNFHGYLSDEMIEEALSSSSLLLSTSPSEAFGMNLLQALSCGLPLVAYDVKYGPALLIENGVNGVLVPQGKYSMAAEAILDFLLNPEKLKAASQKASEKSETWTSGRVWENWTRAQQESGNLFI